MPFVHAARDSPGGPTLALVAGKSYGHTADGREITDEMIEALAAEAEAGYDVDALLARRPKTTGDEARA